MLRVGDAATAADAPERAPLPVAGHTVDRRGRPYLAAMRA